MEVIDNEGDLSWWAGQHAVCPFPDFLTWVSRDSRFSSGSIISPLVLTICQLLTDLTFIFGNKKGTRVVAYICLDHCRTQ
jgi:hypothetical protein